MDNQLTPGAYRSAGQAALDRGAWVEARAWFSRALDLEQAPEAYEGLGMAASGLEDVAAAVDAWEHAYRLYQERDDRRGGARVAIWLALDQYTLAISPVEAEAYLARARRLLDALEPGPEHGWLALAEAHLARNVGHDLVLAQHHAERAVALGRLLGLSEVEEGGRALLDQVAATSAASATEPTAAKLTTTVPPAPPPPTAGAQSSPTAPAEVGGERELASQAPRLHRPPRRPVRGGRPRLGPAMVVALVLLATLAVYVYVAARTTLDGAAAPPVQPVATPAQPNPGSPTPVATATAAPQTTAGAGLVPSSTSAAADITTTPTAPPDSTPSAAEAQTPAPAASSPVLATPTPEPATAAPIPASPTPALGAVQQQVAGVVADVRSGRLDVTIEYRAGTRAVATIRFDRGDEQRAPRLHSTITYRSASDAHTTEQIVVGEQAWQRQADGRWTRAAGQEVWTQVLAYLPQLSGRDVAVDRGDGETLLRWHDASGDADATLTVDPATGEPRRLHQVVRATETVLTVTYTGWNTPVDIAPPTRT